MLISKCLLCNNFYFFVRQRQIVYPAAAPLYTPTPAQANTLALTGVSAAIGRIASALSASINSINLQQPAIKRPATIDRELCSLIDFNWCQLHKACCIKKARAFTPWLFTISYKHLCTYLKIGQTIDQLKYYTTTFSPKLHLKVHCFKNSQWCSFAHIKGKSLPNQGIIVCQFKYL